MPGVNGVNARIRGVAVSGHMEPDVDDIANGVLRGAVIDQSSGRDESAALTSESVTCVDECTGVLGN